MNIFSAIILVQIFIFALCLLIVIGYFSLRKLVLPCFGCSRGSWWYTCAANTGYGTSTCELYKKTYGTFSEAINSFYLLINHFDKLFDAIKFLMNKINIDIPKFTHDLEHKQLSSQNTDAKMQPPGAPSISQPSCYISWMGIDPCSPIRDAVNGMVRGFYAAGGGLISGLAGALRLTLRGFIQFLKLVIKGIMKLCKLIIENITKPIKILINLITKLTEEITNFVDNIINLGIVNIIIFNIISFLNMIIPGPIIGLISYAGMILFICVVLPFIAFTYMIFSIIFEIAIFPLRVAWWIIYHIFSKLFSIIT